MTKAMLALLLMASAASGSSLSVLSGSPPVAGGPTVAFVDFALSAGSSSTTTQTISKTLASGQFIVVGVGWEDLAYTASVSDTLGNTYTALTRAVSDGKAYSQLFWAPVTSAGATTITIDWGALNVSYTKAIAWAFTGATALDGQNTGTGTGSSAVASGTVTTTQASEALCAVVKHYDPVTVTPQGHHG